MAFQDLLFFVLGKKTCDLSTLTLADVPPRSVFKDFFGRKQVKIEGNLI
jgi:hypothetical protein